MGLFNYGMKEGPGVDKNEKKKKGIFLYIDVVFRKFLKLMQTDSLYFLCAIPYLVLVFCFVTPFVMRAFGIDANISQNAQSIAEANKNINFSADMYIATADVVMRSIIACVMFVFMGAGPISASYAYITKCFTQSQHTWIGSDGWDKFKENLKQSIILVALDLVVTVLAMNAVYFYHSLQGSADGINLIFFRYAGYFTVILYLVYMFMHIYIYQIMVTYKCTFIELIKYSVIIAIAKLPMTVILTAIACGVLYLLFNFIGNPFIAAIILAVVGLTFTRYPFEFYASRVIDKNIKAERKKANKNKAKITYIEE